MTDQSTHFLVWKRFRMACGKRPDEIWGSASFWSEVTCSECIATRDAIVRSMKEIEEP